MVVVSYSMSSDGVEGVGANVDIVGRIYVSGIEHSWTSVVICSQRVNRVVTMTGDCVTSSGIAITVKKVIAMIQAGRILEWRSRSDYSLISFSPSFFLTYPTPCK